MMDLLTLDFETYYSPDYTLEKLTTEAYVRDPRFEVILVGVKINDTPAFWIFEDRLRDFLENEMDPAKTACSAFHAHFDGFILSHHFDWRPAMWLDPLSMARNIRGAKNGNSLARLLIQEGLREKGDYVTYAKGKRKADFTGAEMQDYGRYCCRDTDGCYELTQLYSAQLPEHELRLIDLETRMFTEPVFEGDIPMLQEAVIAEQSRRTELLTKCGAICLPCNGTGSGVKDLIEGTLPCKHCKGTGFNKKLFTSNDQFADLLRRFGAEPETKTSPTTGEQIYAFAKTDPAMQELLEDEDEDVRDLAETRIAIKSNIIESRATRYIACAQRGPMPVYLSHAGAHTLRPSGGDSMNWLNLSKHNDKRPEMMVLKKSIKAPAGHVIMEADSSQGEARILGYVANQDDLTEAFAQGRDVYSEHATSVYGRPVDRKRVEADFIPGQVGKIGILSYGFGSGWYKSATELLKGALGAPPIQFTMEHIKAMSINPDNFLNKPKKVALVDQMPSRLELNDRLIHCIVADALVMRYRQKYQRITNMRETAGNPLGFWGLCEQAINAMIEGREMLFGGPQHNLFRTEKDKLWGPTGLWMDYKDIHRREDGEATYFNGRNRTKIYGSLLCENVVQNFHRLVVSEQMLEIAKVLKVALWPYDAVATVVPEEAAPLAHRFMIETLSKSPAYAPGLPLAAEGGWGKTLFDAGKARKMEAL